MTDTFKQFEPREAYHLIVDTTRVFSGIAWKANCVPASALANRLIRTFTDQEIDMWVEAILVARDASMITDVPEALSHDMSASDKLAAVQTFFGNRVTISMVEMLKCDPIQE